MSLDYKSFWAGFEKRANRQRPNVNQLQSSMMPTMVVVFNPDGQDSKLFLQRLDEALEQSQGLERLQIVAFNQQSDRGEIGQLGGSLEYPEIIILAGGEEVARLPGGAETTPMQIQKFIRENLRGL